MLKACLISAILIFSGYTDCNDSPTSNNSNDHQSDPSYGVWGRILDQDTNQTIPSVRVCVISSNLSLCASSNGVGIYSIIKESGDYKLTATHPDYISYAKDISIRGISVKHDIKMIKK